MQIQNNYYNPTFQAKFIKNDTLKAVRKYAQQLHKEDKLDDALNNINKIRKETLLEIDTCYTNDVPTIVFSRYERQRNPQTGLYTGDYALRSQTDYENTNKKNMNIIKFAFKKLIKLGNDAPDNNMFQQVVIDDSFNANKHRLF